jgi:Tfp pilus assembly protein PilX
MKNPLHIVNNETGSLMVIGVVILMLLTFIGIAITTTTSIELQIAGNDKLQKFAFYTADGATEVASELLEQNLGCMAGVWPDSQMVEGV